MDIEIFLPDGTLSEYGYCLGYVQTKENLTIHKELYKEHGTYHVRSLYNNTPSLNTVFDGSVSHKYIVWESFNRLTDAKKLYSVIK